MVGDMLKFNVMHHSLIFYGACARDNCENRQTTSKDAQGVQNPVI